ncbi:hypothetical protein [Parasitella parasitica]|uniref:Uncharacterized protein n=1 Tax=Parasitella parasitica TaxID=35722 RepID=A0A0B7NLV7_9FUNG|nr:hypothetical protein [Parasitella parasitica]
MSPNFIKLRPKNIAKLTPNDSGRKAVFTAAVDLEYPSHLPAPPAILSYDGLSKNLARIRTIPLIAFGAGMFGKDLVKMKGLQYGVVGKLFRTLKRREAEGKLIVATIDEFKTSKTCNLSFSDDLNLNKADNSRDVVGVETLMPLTI